jgi:tetratricopeptide (TPR) repeat protein
LKHLLLLTLLLVPAGAGAQTAECQTTDCAGRQASPARERLWADAAAVRPLKLAFVEALQQFMRAQAGTFGDEGAALLASVASMRGTLARWDEAVGQFTARASRLLPEAEVHVATATVLLDRGRIEDALKELDAAERLQPGRLDVHTLQSLAFDTLDRPDDAARALRTAVFIGPGNPSLFYRLAVASERAARSDDAARARVSLRRALAGGTKDAARGAPFERIGLLRQAAGAAPIFPQARYAPGFAALEAGEYAAAVEQFAEAAAGDPLVAGDPASRDRVAAAARALREGRLASAHQDLQALVTESVDHAEARRVLGLLFWIDDQAGASIEQLRAAVRLAPGDERARVLLADVLAGDRRLAEAERELTQAIEAGVRSGQVYQRLAQVYERQSLLPQATEALRESGRLGPVAGRDEFHRALGSLLVNQADFDGAVAAYSRRIDVNPNNGEAHRQLGEIYFLQGRHDEALAEFAVAAWLDPADARAHAGAGQVHVRLLEHAEAVAAFERALALDAALREARYGLAISLQRLGRTAEASSHLETFRVQQAEAEALGQRAFQLDALRRDGSRALIAGTLDAAIERFREALALDPGAARSHRDLGLSLLRAKQMPEAIGHLQRAQEIDSTAEGFALLADAHTVAGNTQEAARQRQLQRDVINAAKLERLQALAK